MPGYGYGYGAYPGPGGYYAPPMPDQLAQLRQQQFQPPVVQGPPMQQPPPAPQPAMQQAAQPAISGPYYVSGDAGARGYLVAANTTVLLFDADPDANTFWLKSADAAGMPSMRTFDYTERLQAPKTAQETPQAPAVDFATRSDLEALSARYDAIAQELEALKSRTTCKCEAKKEGVSDE